MKYLLMLLVCLPLTAETERHEPLVHAILSHDLAKTRELIQAGLDPKAALDDHLSVFGLAVSCGWTPIIKAMLDAGVDPNLVTGEGPTPLLRACRQGRLGAARLLIESGADVNKADQSSETPLLAAISKNDFPMARLLVLNGADIHQPDKNGNTPLLVAVGRYNRPIVKMLLAHGADPNRGNKKRKTPLGLMKKKPQDPIALLLEEGKSSEPVAADLFQAAAWNDLSRVEALITEGAEVATLDKRGRSPLYVAASHAEANLVETLIQFGASIQATSSDGHTPLMRAVQWRRIDTAEKLILLGSDVNAVSSHGRSPLNLALAQDDKPMIALLLKHGARVIGFNPQGEPVKAEPSQLPAAHTANLRALYEANPFVDRRGKNAEKTENADHPKPRLKAFHNSVGLEPVFENKEKGIEVTLPEHLHQVLLLTPDEVGIQVFKQIGELVVGSWLCKDGVTRDIQLLRYEGPERALIEDQLKRKLTKWKFIPATIEGEPEDYYFLYKFSFELKQQKIKRL